MTFTFPNIIPLGPLYDLKEFRPSSTLQYRGKPCKIAISSSKAKDSIFLILELILNWIYFIIGSPRSNLVDLEE